jgi:nucleotide-binding universal stress UspA family protein
MRLVAAVGNDVAARPVLATARALADRFGWVLDAIHIKQDGEAASHNAARIAQVELRILTPPLVRRIAEATRPADVEGLVIGARGVPAAGNALGTTATALITRIDKPVVVVPPDAPTRQRFERVLVPLDGSQFSEAALRRALAMFVNADLEIVLLHVPFGAAIPPFEDQKQHETDAWSTEFLRRHGHVPGARVRLELRGGLPAEETLKLAQDQHVDLIALGWRQHLNAGRASVVTAVLAHAHVPVIHFPERRDDA